MNYQDFTINVRSVGSGQFEAEVIDAPLRDSPRVEFSRPIEEAALEALDESLNGAEAPAGPSYLDLGQALYKAVFGKGIAKLFTQCEAGLTPGSGLRIRLRFRIDDAEARYLAALPWELLRPPEGKFLGIDQSTPIVREIQGAKPFETLAVEPPLRILIVDAATSPADAAAMKSQIERMEEELGDLIDNGTVELLCLEEPSPDPLRDVLQDEKIHVLHFIGHGGFDPPTGFGAVFFVHPDGTKQQVSGERLASYLDDIPDLRLVVLNSCHTACYSRYAGAPFHVGVAAAILDQTSVPAVIANQYSITYDAASDFSKTFYGRIASGFGVDSAITEARLRGRYESREWATPVLFLGARDGNLFSIKPPKRRSKVRVVRSVGSANPVRLGIRSFDGWGKDMAKRTDAVLDFVPLFDGRVILNPDSWNGEILPRLRDFLLSRIDERRPLLLDFAAHSSIAFAAGWILEAKSGLDVRVRQRIQMEGELEWFPKEGSVPEGPLWRNEPDIILSPTPHPTLSHRTPFPTGEGKKDVALALAVSQPEVAAHVKEYVQSQNLPVGRILQATIAPEPGPRSVASGAHALQLALALLSRIRQRQPHEREGRVHVFAAAPNALTFYLGQVSRSFGKIVLYEHPFGAADAYGKYLPSIELAE